MALNGLPGNIGPSFPTGNQPRISQPVGQPPAPQQMADIRLIFGNAEEARNAITPGRQNTNDSFLTPAATRRALSGSIQTEAALRNTVQTGNIQSVLMQSLSQNANHSATIQSGGNQVVIESDINATIDLRQ